MNIHVDSMISNLESPQQPANASEVHLNHFIYALDGIFSGVESQVPSFRNEQDCRRAGTGLLHWVSSRPSGRQNHLVDGDRY